MSGADASVHGTAFLLGETGLLAVGRSGAGKSGLVLALMASPPQGEPVRLVADDRVRLAAAGGRLVARPVDGFLGRIEMRGFGIADAPAMPSAVIRAILRLTPGDPPRHPDEPYEKQEISGVRLPVLVLREGDGAACRFRAAWPHLCAEIRG